MLNSSFLMARSWKIILNNAGVPFTFASVPPCGLPNQEVPCCAMDGWIMDQVEIHGAEIWVLDYYRILWLLLVVDIAVHSAKNLSNEEGSTGFV